MRSTILLCLLGGCLSLPAAAQVARNPMDTIRSNIVPENSEMKLTRNFIKLNLTGIALRNYSVQYERIFTKTVSAALSFRIMPDNSLPFDNLILDKINTGDTNGRNIIQNLRVSDIALTPEVRFYLSRKGYGHGFYIALFYRFAQFNTNQLPVTFKDDSTGIRTSLNLNGGLTINTAGFMIGAQWFLGPHLCFDWWILGPHFGAESASLTGVSDHTLSQNEQNNLQQKLNDLKIPMANKTTSVNANGASMKLNGGWGGARAGLSLGFRF